MMHRFLPALAFACAGLSGCGSDGGGDSGMEFPSYPATAADSTLQPFVTAAGELKLFDPAAPDAPPLAVDTGLELPTHFISITGYLPFVRLNLLPAGTYDAATHRVTGQHDRFAWYLKDGSIYRVDLFPANSHAPIQVSSIDDVCSTKGLALDYKDPLNTHLIVLSAGDDTDCSTDDDSAHLVTFGTSSGNAGITVSPDLYIVEWIQAPDGGLERILVLQAGAVGEFASYTPDFSSHKQLMPMDAFTTFLGGPDQSRTQQYFRVKPGSDADFKLYRYNAGADDLTPVHTFADDLSESAVADSDFLYFSDGPAFYRVAHDSTAPQLLHTFRADEHFAVTLTTNRLVFRMGGMSGPWSLESLPKAGGSTRTVLEQAGTLAILSLVATAGGKIYYNRGDDGAGYSAKRIGEDGSDAEAIANALWTGAQGSPDGNVGALDPQRRARTLVLGVADESGVVTVRGVDALTAAAGPVLGTIPGVISGRSAGTARRVRLNVLASDFDVYFADVTRADSLRAAAATPDLDDVTPWFGEFAP